MPTHKTCTCGAPFIPTAAQPDYCDLCDLYPELRIPLRRHDPQKKDKDKFYSKLYRERNRAEINRKRREKRRKRYRKAKAHAA